MTTIEVQTVFEGDNLGDYIEVRIIVDGTLYTTYGSHYDEKGQDRAEGYLDGYVAASDDPDIQIEYTELVIPPDLEDIVDDGLEEN